MRKFKNLLVWFVLLVLFNNVFAQQTQNQWGFFNPTTQYRPAVPGPEPLAQDSLLIWIKNFINWVLWLLALIALGVFAMVMISDGYSSWWW